MFIQDEADEHHRKRFSRRAIVLGLGQFLGLGAVTARIYQLQVLEQSRYSLLAEENRINVQILAPVRGRILDRYGELLASNRDNFQAMLVRSLARDMAYVLREFSKIVPLSDGEQAHIIARANRQSPNLPVVITRDLSWEQFAQINLRAPQLPGIQSAVMGRRQYFHGSAVGHVIGYVGAVERFALDDELVMRLPGMKVGKNGVEKGMEQRLRGISGNVKLEVDSRGRIIRNLEKTPPSIGRDVVVTIDTGLQTRVMDRLEQERRAAAVVLDVQSGEVVAMASAPGYDPQQIVKGVSAREWHRMRVAADDPLMNRATRGQYPPGSTFKMVTALAALEAGLVSLDEKVNCDGAYEVADHTFRCWRRSGHGACDLHRAIRESCDVYFYEMANRLGIRALANMARRLGFGTVYDTDIALQKPGLIPSPEWKYGRFNKSWYTGETILAAIGQGYVLSTPLQLAVMTARIATGKKVVPTLVRADEGEKPRIFEPIGIKSKWLQAVRKGMYGVVNEPSGTGRRARLPDGELKVAGKTGTSQVSRRSAMRGKNDLAWKLRDHALFVGYFPADLPRYAVAAVIEHGGGGGAVAAPLVRDIVGLVLEADPAARPAVFGPRKGSSTVSAAKIRS